MFYYSPLGLRLSQVDDTPAFRFDLFRYLGRKETGDTSAFRVRGILSFEAEQIRDVDLIKRMENHLRRTRPGATLRPAPIERFQSELIYKTVEIEEGDAIETGTVEGGVSKTVDNDDAGDKSEGNWKSRLFTIGLEPLTAELFWDNFEKERLQLSI